MAQFDRGQALLCEVQSNYHPICMPIIFIVQFCTFFSFCFNISQVGFVPDNNYTLLITEIHQKFMFFCRWDLWLFTILNVEIWILSPKITNTANSTLVLRIRIFQKHFIMKIIVENVFITVEGCFIIIKTITSKAICNFYIRRTGSRYTHTFINPHCNAYITKAFTFLYIFTNSYTKIFNLEKLPLRTVTNMLK